VEGTGPLPLTEPEAPLTETLALPEGLVGTLTGCVDDRLEPVGVVLESGVKESESDGIGSVVERSERMERGNEIDLWTRLETRTLLGNNEMAYRGGGPRVGTMVGKVSVGITVPSAAA
jgi:hypothetical protein